MAQIRRLWLLTETSSESFSGTNSKLRLDIHVQGDRTFSVDVGDPKRDDFGCGKTGCQQIDVPTSDAIDDTQIREICLRILENHDAWLPKSIWIVSEDIDGECSPLTADPRWHRWFDWDSRPGYSLSLLQQQKVAAIPADP